MRWRFWTYCPRRRLPAWMRWGRRSVRRVPIASAAHLAQHHGVTVGAAQRWLKQGRVPGAFRTTDGWWVPTLEVQGR